ncbi:MAG: hypothetical protein WKF92_05410 [Pyrinomonadaceae bacterium]
MRERSIRRPQARTVSSAEVNPLTWRYLIVMLICGCVLAAGFFFAARQHFSSMEYGINNSRLRKQLEDLESENRRLRHLREVSMSPGEIKKIALNLGFREIERGTVMTASTTDMKVKTAPALIAAKQPGDNTKTTGVIRTAYQTPVTEAPAVRSSNNERAAKQSKKPQPVNMARERTEITTIAKLR